MQNKKKILPEIYNFLRPKQTKNLKRFGIKKDGGYVLEITALSRVSHLVSFVMDDEFSFEIDFLKYNNKNTLQIYDHTVSHKNHFLKILKVLRRIISFRNNPKKLIFPILRYYNFLKFINNKKVNFSPLKITGQITEKKNINIDKVFSLLGKSIDKIGLKIDIEGDEYKILDNVIEKSSRINFLIIEFHNIKENKKIFFTHMDKLIKIFDIIHIHGNNHEFILPDGFPNVIEVSLVNKKNNLIYTKYPTSFPIEGLDYPNNPASPDIEINF